MFSTIQPIIFVLTFRYVFGGSSTCMFPGGLSYVDFLMPGVFVQTVAFGAEHWHRFVRRLHKGLIVLPVIAHGPIRGAGRPFAVGSRPQLLRRAADGGRRVPRRLPDAHERRRLPASIGLLLFFSFALSWLFALIGLRVRTPSRAGRVVPDPRPARVCVDRVRADRRHAGLAPGPQPTSPCRSS